MEWVQVVGDIMTRDLHVRPRLKAELKSFARMWFRNLCAQGFLGQ